MNMIQEQYGIVDNDNVPGVYYLSQNGEIIAECRHEEDAKFLLRLCELHQPCLSVIRQVVKDAADMQGGWGAYISRNTLNQAIHIIIEEAGEL